MIRKIALSLCSLLIFSCASAHLPVPGEGKVIKNNISAEYIAIADAYSDLGKYDKAISYYKLGMNNRKLYWTCYYKLGRAYALNKNYNEARKVFNRLYKRDRNNLNIKMSIAYLDAMSGKLKESEDVYSLLCKENPENAEILVNYIDLLIVNKQYSEAKNKLNYLKDKFKENSSIKDLEKKLEELAPEKLKVELESEDKTVQEIQKD